MSEFRGRGVFAAWDDANVFRAAHIAAHGAIEWGNDIGLCADALYMRLTGKSPEDLHLL